MKKNLQILRKSLVVGLFFGIVLLSSNVFSQGNNWRLNGNNNVNKNDFIGTTNNADFVIRTNNQERIRVTTDKHTIFEDSVRIKGPLFVGENSYNMHPTVATGSGDVVRISSNHFAINHMRSHQI